MSRISNFDWTRCAPLELLKGNRRKPKATLLFAGGLLGGFWLALSRPRLSGKSRQKDIGRQADDDKIDALIEWCEKFRFKNHGVRIEWNQEAWDWKKITTKFKIWTRPVRCARSRTSLLWTTSQV